MKSIFSISKVVLLSLLVVVMASCGGKEERKVKYLEKGKAYLEQNNLDKAKIEFKNVIQIDPKFAEAYYYMGQMEEKNKELRKALSYYNKAIELKPGYIEPKVKVAKIYVVINTKEYVDKAKALLKEVFAVDPENAEARLISATIDYKFGKKDKAIKDIAALLSKHGDLPEGVSLLATLYSSRGEDVKAMSVLKKGISKNNNNIILSMLYAKLLVVNKKNEEAEKQMLKIIQIEPGNYSHRINLSAFYSTSNQVDKAEKVLREAIKDDEDDATRYLVLVKFIASRKSIKEAEAELLKAIKQKSDLYDLKFALSDFYLKTRAKKKAKNILEKIINDKTYDVEGVKARVKLASMLLAGDSVSDALKVINDVLKEYPNNNDALLINSKIALINKDTLTAINDLRTLLKNQPKNTEASLLLANAHLINKEKELAEDVLKNSIASSPADYKAHYNYAKYLLAMKKYDEASNVVNKGLLYFNDNYELMELKLVLAASANNESDMIKILDAMQAKHSDKGDVYIKKGKYYLTKRKYADAINEFEKAYTKIADKYQSLELIVKTYIAQKAPKKAIKRLMAILDKQPEDAIAHQLLGKIYGGQKDFSKARNSFRKAINSAKGWSMPYMGLASTYVVDNNYQKAIDVYKEAIQNGISSAVIQIQLAALYEKEKKYADAMKVYEEILLTNSRNMVARNNLAALLVENNPDQKALNRAKELTSNFAEIKQPAFKDTLGWVYVKTGENDKAVKVLEEVVKTAPKVAVFKYHLAVALNNIGDSQNAKKYLAEAVKSKQQFIGKSEAKKLLDSL